MSPPAHLPAPLLMRASQSSGAGPELLKTIDLLSSLVLWAEEVTGSAQGHKTAAL